MRQRVVIALALCAEPRLVIADEPTTALDVSIQAQIIALLKRITRDHGTSVMLVTHDMGVIAETADRVAVMYAGRIAEIGPVAEVVKHPAHPYTEGLMGSIPSLEHRVERLRQIDGAMPRLTAIPPGCAFNPRCPKVFDRCLAERPELLDARATRAPAGSMPMAEPPCPSPQTPPSSRRIPCWKRSKSPGFRRLQALAAAPGAASSGAACARWIRLSFAIPRGTTLSLVGESGCGKSTVARLAVGLYAPSGGEIRFEGQPLSAARAQARRCGGG